MKRDWNDDEIRSYIESQSGFNSWYQTIPIKEGITIKGSVDSLSRLVNLDLEENLSGKSVLDIGCNSGMLCFESKKRNAEKVVGIDLKANRIQQARTLAEIMRLDISFEEMNLFDAMNLGEFDIVFCIAVLTEVTDIIGGLEVLKKVCKGTLYLEIATIESFMQKHHFFHLLQMNLINKVSKRKTRNIHGYSYLRRIESRYRSGWALVPNMEFISTIMGDKFTIFDLGPSTRYNLLKLVKKE